MAELPLGDANNTLKSSKLKDYPSRAKGISFTAFLLSIIIYISIFYIFKLSPTTLFNNPKFWFFISNTLILIIAADYGAFSSSKQNQDLYEEHVVHRQARSSAYAFVSQYPDMIKKSIPQRVVEDFVESKQVALQKTEVPEKILEVVTKSEPEKPSDNLQETKPIIAPKDHIETYKKKKSKTRDCRPSKSDKDIQMVNDENTIILHQSETEKSKPSVEENEFSTMSDEELNRRVEEFIQKFNRQIRLQRARSFSQS